MKKDIYILINSIDKVKKFQNVISKYDGDFDLISGNMEVDARSFLGIMTLNLSQPIELLTNCESDKLYSELEVFAAKEE